MKEKNNDQVSYFAGSLEQGAKNHYAACDAKD